MPRFFIPPTEEKTVRIQGDDASHITRSLRMQVGDAIVLSDGQGFDYSGTLSSLGQGFVDVSILEKAENQTEPQVKITLYQALPKGDKLSFIVEKTVELGGVEIVPVLTSRCISRPNPKSMERKIQRYQKTAEEAAKQSDRGMIPRVAPLLSFSEALEQAKAHDLSLLFYELETTPLREILTPDRIEHTQSIGVFIGSEGGFSPKEVDEAEKAGLVSASLGARILRAETAPIAALSALFYAFGEF